MADETAVREPQYVYRARLVKVIDGDTIDVDLDVGFGVWLHKQRLRLYGINTPETRGVERPEGLAAKAFVQAELPLSRPLLIQTHADKKGKYGRWVAEVWYLSHHDPSGTLQNLNKVLVAEGHAKEVSY